MFSTHYLDFGFDSTRNSFTFKNIGTGTLHFSIFKTQEWISVSPIIGDLTTQPQTITVTINRAGLLPGKKYVESIEVDSHVGEDIARDTINVLLNGIMDRDSNYYGIVKIGTQTWMAENLNTGKQISSPHQSTNNGKVEKYCYNNLKENCKIYGGLYTWSEVLQYPNDPYVGDTSLVQGLCPDGWHIPNHSEVFKLFGMNNYISYNAGKYKEEGTVHWRSPNMEATNETGYTALPGGYKCNTEYWHTLNEFDRLGQEANFWTTMIDPNNPSYAGAYYMRYDSSYVQFRPRLLDKDAMSVRCIKDPQKK